MLNDTEQGNTRTVPDVSKTSRFAMGIGLILLAYILAEGQLTGGSANTPVGSDTPVGFTTPVGFIEFHSPYVLWIFLVATSVFASYRYWYYGIKVPFTRTKIRKYLKGHESVLVWKGSEYNYRDAIKTTNNEICRAHSSLEQRCPPGLTPFEFIIFTDAIIAPSDGYMRKFVANRVNRYFPDIVSDEIELENRTDHAWASVDKDKLKTGTRWREVLEDLDLFAPLLINGLGPFEGHPNTEALITGILRKCDRHHMNHVTPSTGF